METRPLIIEDITFYPASYYVECNKCGDRIDVETTDAVTGVKNLNEQGFVAIGDDVYCPVCFRFYWQ